MNIEFKKKRVINYTELSFDIELEGSFNFLFSDCRFSILIFFTSASSL